jgi:hypothetical protein
MFIHAVVMHAQAIQMAHLIFHTYYVSNTLPKNNGS